MALRIFFGNNNKLLSQIAEDGSILVLHLEEECGVHHVARLNEPRFQ